MLILIKYLFSVVLTVATLHTTHNTHYLLFGFLELTVIFLLSNACVKKNKIFGNIINDLFLLLYNSQMLVLFFANSYIIAIMLTNLNSLEDISGKALQYGIGVVLLLLATFLPIRQIRFPRITLPLCLGLLIAEVILSFIFGFSYSPALAYGTLGINLAKSQAQKAQIASGDSTLTQTYREELYRESLPDYRAKDTALPEKPNVIIIFSEGISEEFVYDDRNLMPNTKALAEKSLRVTGYWNHTMATYRALIGQLYSGYQLENFDSNDLISLQQIFKEQGYHTTLINTEPANKDFTNYLAAMDYDELIGPALEEMDGYAGTASDQQSYEYLLSTIRQLRGNDSPYFITLYTIGTHASFDSTKERFGDGSNHLLNRIYNMDTCIGSFLEQMESEGLFEDTLFVFTTDHATYHDNDYTDAMKGRLDDNKFYAMLDAIPLYFYYPGITPETLEVNGRNTLDFAPTLLDYLDFSVPNYFLGTSLFAPNESADDLEYLFHAENDLIFTKGNVQVAVSGSQKDDLLTPINRYFIAKLPILTNIDDSCHLDFQGVKSIQITYQPDHPVNQVWIPVWSESDGQDDLKWVEMKAKKDGSFTCKIKIRDHLSKKDLKKGETLLLQIYEGDDSPETCVLEYSIRYWGKTHTIQ